MFGFASGLGRPRLPIRNRRHATPGGIIRTPREVPPESDRGGQFAAAFLEHLTDDLGRRLVDAEHGAGMRGETDNGQATLPRPESLSGPFAHLGRITGMGILGAHRRSRGPSRRGGDAPPLYNVSRSCACIARTDYEDAHRARKGHNIRRTYSGTGMKTARYIPPEGELSVWCFVHQLAIEQERGLQLAGLLLTPFPRRRPIGLTRDEFRAVGKVRARLAVYRQLGALPEGGVSWIWPDGPRPTPVVCQSEEWLKAKMADCCCFNLRVPHRIARLRSHS